MKKFRFKLDPVLKIRRHEEELQEQQFARQMQLLIGLKEQWNTARTGLDQYTGRQQDNKDALCSPAEYRQQNAFIQARQQELARLSLEIEQSKQRTEQERQKLIVANQRTRVLEDLKEKKRLEYLAEADREDQKMMNEIATQRFHRKSG